MHFLDKEIKASIKLILKADTLKYKFASPIADAERSRLTNQLKSQGPKLAYSTTKEDVVETEESLYKHLNKLSNARKPDEAWKDIPTELKKEHAITFACMLAQLNKSKKPIQNLLKDFYETTVTHLDTQTQNWIQGIIPSRD